MITLPLFIVICFPYILHVHSFTSPSELTSAGTFESRHRGVTSLFSTQQSGDPGRGGGVQRPPPRRTLKKVRQDAVSNWHAVFRTWVALHGYTGTLIITSPSPHRLFSIRTHILHTTSERTNAVNEWINYSENQMTSTTVAMQKMTLTTWKLDPYEDETPWRQGWIIGWMMGIWRGRGNGRLLLRIAR